MTQGNRKRLQCVWWAKHVCVCYRPHRLDICLLWRSSRRFVFTFVLMTERSPCISTSLFSFYFSWRASRTYKRYYYFHDTTGESSWEYPEDAVKETVTSSQVPTPPSQHPGHPAIPPPNAQASDVYHTTEETKSETNSGSYQSRGHAAIGIAQAGVCVWGGWRPSGVCNLGGSSCSRFLRQLWLALYNAHIT